MNELIVTCPECNGKYNGRTGIVGAKMRHIGSHSHTGSDQVDPRFLDCPHCHGRGAMTCERCEGAGRIVLKDGIQVGIHAKPPTSAVLGPRPMKRK